METITWEEKVEMVTIGNQDKQPELLQFILDNMIRFDHQAWDMAIESLEINDEVISNNVNGYEKVAEAFEEILDNLKGAEAEFSFRTLLRAGVLRGRVNELRPEPDPSNYESGNDLI